MSCSNTITELSGKYFGDSPKYVSIKRYDLYLPNTGLNTEFNKSILFAESNFTDTLLTISEFSVTSIKT